jgi:hypothetical protein
MKTQDPLELHRKLLDDGWTRRFTGEEPRLSEMREFYESLGFEVRVVPAILEESTACRTCFDLKGFETRYKTIYTRVKPQGSKHSSEDLFDQV